MTVPVSRGGGPVRPLPPKPRRLLTTRTHDSLGGTPTLRSLLIATHTDALVVLHEGRIAAEWYADPTAETTPHPLHSVTKSWVGCLAGILIDRGELVPEAPATAYVPALANGGYAGVTVRDLLDMRTGGDYAEIHDDPGGELAIMGEIVGWRDETGQAATVSLREYAAYVPRIGLNGGPFSYRSLDTEVLGWVIEEVTGVPLAELIGDWLLGPVGAEADGLMTVDRVGDPLASGGLSLIPRDVARFGQMLLDGGSVGRKQIVPTMFIKDTRIGQPDSVGAFHARVGERLGPNAPYPAQGIYRNQFWVPRQGGRQLLCLGVHGQTIMLDGESQMVAVKLSSWPTPQSPQLFSDGLACLTACAEILSGRSDEVSMLR